MKQKFSFHVGENRFVYQVFGAQGDAPEKSPEASREIPAGMPSRERETLEARAKAAAGAAKEKLARLETDKELEGSYATAYQKLDVYLGVLGDQILEIWGEKQVIGDFKNMVIEPIQKAFDSAGIPDKAPDARRIELAFQGLGGEPSGKALQQLFDSYRTTARIALAEKQHDAKRYQELHRTIGSLLRQYRTSDDSGRRRELFDNLTGLLITNYEVKPTELALIDVLTGDPDRLTDQLTALALGSIGVDAKRAREEYVAFYRANQ